MQPTLPFDTLAAAQSRRDAVLAQLDDANGPAFSERAAAFVLSYLREHGDSPGEDITDAARNIGIWPESGDGRRFGPVYMRLARAGRIVRRGHCSRRHGNGTAGGNVWGLA